VVIGGIEGSLRRIAHYDYWSDTVRRSVLQDSKADMLLFGNAERALVELTHRLAGGRIDQGHPRPARHGVHGAATAGSLPTATKTRGTNWIPWRWIRRGGWTSIRIPYATTTATYSPL
jgi:radical SAM superfamily enzyme YgiQ (UPF0313 family)